MNPITALFTLLLVTVFINDGEPTDGANYNPSDLDGVIRLACHILNVTFDTPTNHIIANLMCALNRRHNHGTYWTFTDTRLPGLLVKHRLSDGETTVSLVETTESEPIAEMNNYDILLRLYLEHARHILNVSRYRPTNNIIANLMCAFTRTAENATHWTYTDSRVPFLQIRQRKSDGETTVSLVPSTTRRSVDVELRARIIRACQILNVTENGITNNIILNLAVEFNQIVEDATHATYTDSRVPGLQIRQRHSDGRVTVSLVETTESGGSSGGTS